MQFLLTAYDGTDEKAQERRLIYDFPSRTGLEEVLKKEPYVVGKVWQKTEIVPCTIGPSFTGLS